MVSTRSNPKTGTTKTIRKTSGKTPFQIYRGGGSTKEIRLTVALVLVARRWRSLIDESLRPLSQSSARKEALSAILNSPDPSSQIDIANRLRIEGPTMTRMIDVLSRDGLVERRPAPDDRRTKHLSVTEEGESSLEEAFGVTDALRARLLDGLSEEQIDMMTDVLGILMDRLDQGLPAPDTAGDASQEEKSSKPAKSKKSP